MERDESQQSHTAASTQQVLNGAREDLNEKVLRVMKGRKSGKIMLEIFFEDGQATSALLHSKFACTK